MTKEKEIEENRKMRSNWYNEGFSDGEIAGVIEGQNSQKEKDLEMIEDFDKDLDNDNKTSGIFIQCWKEIKEELTQKIKEMK
jgi:hypothetical protein